MLVELTINGHYLCAPAVRSGEGTADYTDVADKAAQRAFAHPSKSAAGRPWRVIRGLSLVHESNRQKPFQKIPSAGAVPDDEQRQPGNFVKPTAGRGATTLNQIRLLRKHFDNVFRIDQHPFILAKKEYGVKIPSRSECARLVEKVLHAIG